MFPRNVEVVEGRTVIFPEIQLSSIGPGFIVPPVCVNIRPLTYSQYEAIGGDLDQEFPLRPSAAADGESTHDVCIFIWRPTL